MKAEHFPKEWSFDDIFDAVDLGCGDLLLDLKIFANPLRPGTRFVVASRDIGSPREIPAWCRLTGNRLIAGKPPYYLIEKKNNHHR